MLQQFAGSLTDTLLKKEIVKEEDKEIYIYGFEAMFSTVINTLLIITIGILIDMLLETTIFFVSFAILRVYCGGFHAKTHLGCISAFVTIYGFAMAITNFFPLQYATVFSIAIGAASLLFILKYAPIEHKNRPFVENELKNFQLMSRIIALLEMAITVLISVFIPKFIKVSLIISIAMFSVAFILALAKIIERKR